MCGCAPRSNLLRDRWEPTPAHDELDRLRREHAEAREHARRDCLTASYNRRYLDERLATLLDEPNVLHAGLSIALVGHRPLQAGQRPARPSPRRPGAPAGGVPPRRRPPGRRLRGALRRGGVRPRSARLRPRRPRSSIGERARQRVDEYPWHDVTPELRVTVSIGISHDVAQPPDVSQLIVDSDQLLYAAKDSGRNAVAYRDAAGLGPVGRCRFRPPGASPSRPRRPPDRARCVPFSRHSGGVRPGQVVRSLAPLVSSMSPDDGRPGWPGSIRSASWSAPRRGARAA